MERGEPMTDENRAELRRGLEMLIRSFLGGLAVKHGQRFQVGPTVGHVVRTGSYPPDAYEKLPPITTAQQLALSVLLGDDIPLGVLLSACEDAGVFADGLEGEIAEKARAEERERIAAVCDGCAEACQLGVLSGSDDSRTCQNVYRNIAATARKLT